MMRKTKYLEKSEQVHYSSQIKYILSWDWTWVSDEKLESSYVFCVKTVCL